MANEITGYNRNGRNLSVFDDFFDSMLNAWGSYSSKVPAVDIEETADDFVIKAELPGYSENDVKIYVEKHVLHISGEENSKEEDKEGRKYLIKERRHTAFERSFSLPDGLDESAINATFENGILTVTLPKLPEEKPRHIEVKIGSKN